MKFSPPLSQIFACAAVVTAMPVAAQQIEFNDDRQFLIDDNTAVTRNGDPVPAQPMIQIGTGYQSRIQIGTGGSVLLNGTLISIDFDDRLVGPVTSLAPLTVLSIPVVVTGDTELFNIPGDDVSNLMVGDEVYVSGYSDLDASVLASRIELPMDPITTWRIEGYADSVTATSFSIGSQMVDYSAALIVNCPGDVIANGDFVDVESTPDMAYMAGSTLIADEVECDPDRLDGDGPAVVDGIITTVTDPNLFTVGEQVVSTDANTVYVNGTIDDIEVGVRVEAEGTLDDTTDVLAATKVKIREIKVRFEAPVAPGDVVTGSSITIMSNTLTTTAQTRDEDGIIASGLGADTQVEVRGFIDADGNLFATRVRERGNPDPADAEVRGPATNISDPTLTILGVSVDTTGAVFRDAFDMPITSADFFATIAEGIPVGVEGGQYDAMTNSISGGIVSIEDEAVEDQAKAATVKGTAIGGQGIGLVSGRGDLLFSSGFEQR